MDLNKAYKIIIHSSAKNGINSIYNYCLYKYGKNYAIKIRKIIKIHIKKLNVFPNSNPIYAIYNNNIFRKHIVNGRYIIVFKVYYNFIHVYYVYDGRQNINESNLFS